MKQRMRKMYFSLLFFEHQYLTNYSRLTSKIFYTYRQHSNLVNCVSDFFCRAQFSFYKIKKNNMKKEHKSFPFFVIK